MDPYVIYAFYNAEQVQGVLNAIVMLMGSGGVDGDFLALVRVAGMLGLFIAVAIGFVRARGEDAGAYLIMMAFFYSALFLPRVTVTIQDVGYAAGAPRTVANVPIGLAFFASTTSKIGYWLTDRTETVFAFPDANISFTKGGLMGASRALREAQSTSFTEPILAQDMQIFMRDCINPEILLNPPALPSLLTTRNIWTSFNSLGLVNPGRVVSLASQPSATDCGDAYTNIIGPRLPGQVAAEQTRIAKIISPFVPAANADTILATLLPASEGLIMTSSSTAAEAIQQRMMINLLNDTSQTLGQVMNDPTAVQNAAATAMASQSANSSYRVMAKLAAETLPMIRNAIDLVIISVFPIILIMIIIAGTKGGMVLKSYVMTMLWVQLWAPLYAIVNYVGTMTGAKSMTAALEGIDGVTVTNAAQLLNTSISGEAVVGLLTISVPVIALALVKGGEMAMTGVVSGLTGPSQHAADKAGQAVGAGNISAGNVQWGNYSAHSANANKYNTDYSSASGGYSFRDGGGMTETQYRDGTTALSQPKHDTTLSSGNVAALGRELSSQAVRSTQAAFGNLRAATEQQSAIFGEMVSQIRSGGITNSNAIGVAGREAGSLNQSFGGDKMAGTEVTASSGAQQRTVATNQARFQGSANAAAAMNVGSGAEAAEGASRNSSRAVPQGQTTTLPVQPGQTVTAGGVNATDQHTQSARRNQSFNAGGRSGFDLAAAIAMMQSYEAGISKAISQGDKTSATQLASERQSYLSELARTHGFTNTEQGVTQGSRGLDARLASASTHIEQAQAQFQQANRLDESSRVMQSASVSASHNGIADTGKFSASDQRAILSDLKNAKSPEQYMAVLEGLAARIAGSQMGREHATSHISGQKVLGTEGAIEAKNGENMKSGDVQNKTAEKHDSNKGRVPVGKVGAESVSPQSGLAQAADGYIKGTKGKFDAENGKLGVEGRKDLTRVQGETGFVEPNPRSSNMSSVSKLANRSSDNMTSDAETSLRQILPNSIPGSMPTLDQHQERIGYDPANPQQARPAAAPTEQNSRPQAPENWMPKIPEKKAASGR